MARPRREQPTAPQTETTMISGLPVTINKEQEVNTTDPTVEFPNSAIGTYQDKNNRWHVVQIDFNGETGQIKSTFTDNGPEEDRPMSVERFKIAAVKLNIV